MKIGIFLPNATFDLPGAPEVGGIETFAFTIGEAWQQLGHEVVLYGGRPKYGRIHRRTSLSLRLHDYIETQHIPDLGTRFQRLVQRLHFGWTTRKEWLRENFDVILLSKPFDWPLAAYWKKKATRRPFIVMGFHGEDYFFGCEKFYRFVDAAFAVSAPIAERAKKKIGVRPPCIPNPVDTDFFSPAEPYIKSCHTIFASGRLVGWKGYDRLIEAMAFVLKKHATLSLRLAGEGPVRTELEEKTRELGIADRVAFLGKLDPERLREELRRATLYVQPSIGIEAFSISALEAAACGVPLILSDQVGLKDYLSERDMLIYPAGKVEALASAIDQALGRNDEAWWDAQARHERIARRFSPKQIAQEILALVS